MSRQAGRVEAKRSEAIQASRQAATRRVRAGKAGRGEATATQPGRSEEWWGEAWQVVVR
jgi:hypothetical protein